MTSRPGTASSLSAEPGTVSKPVPGVGASAAPDSVLSELLRGRPDRIAAVRHVEWIPARHGTYDGWPAWVGPELRAAVTRRGVAELWTHQRAAADLLHGGVSTIVATGTGSGKSLAYALPALQAVLDGRAALDGRGATVLYLAPTKALAADQERMLAAIAPAGVRTSVVDGDTPPDERDWARKHAAYVLTNPDLLHHWLLPRHARWSNFLRNLRFVVVDEAHAYRGVFGSHVAQVLRRLRRVCEHYGAHPTFALASATLAAPESFAGRLVGEPVTAVVDDGAPRGELGFALWEPDEHRDALTESAEIMADLVASGAQTVTFVRSRRAAETVALAATDALAARRHPARVAAYRAGYLPEERRDLEAALQSGELGGLAATNALELGVDVSALDAVVMAGYPGSRASMWQQAGRAGRAGRAALAVLVARADPFDTYLVRNPATLFGAPVEETVLDPDNPYVLAPHLVASAAEIPLREDDLEAFGPQARRVVDELTEQGLLRRRPTGWFWTHRDRASELADLRGTGGAPVRIAEVGTGRLLGTVEAEAAPRTVHEGAVYVHQGLTHVVVELDLDAGCAHVERADVPYVTVARSSSELRVLSIERSERWPGAELFTGAVEVTDQVISYVQLAAPSGPAGSAGSAGPRGSSGTHLGVVGVLGVVPLDLPARTMRTRGTWWTVDPAALAEHGVVADQLDGALHAAEHTALALLPLVATCDRWDIGGASAPHHPDTAGPTVFVHDRYAGGAGFAERAYAAAPVWLEATRTVIASCDCDEGCPSCVQSPSCGRGNTPLAKSGAARLLSATLGVGPRND